MLCFICIFFFKQKTAYEMRISDWSSACALPICRVLQGQHPDHPQGQPDQPEGDGDGAEPHVRPARRSSFRSWASSAPGTSWASTVTSSTRSEERRGGKECVSTCRSRGSPDH